jgi:hypothetical protein
MLERGNDIVIELFTPEDKPYGLTYGQWTVKWWQWAHTAPKNVNPLLDETGKYASIDQDGPVCFLAGTAGENKLIQRICKIPSEKAILFPVINYEMNPIEKPELKTESELIRHVIEDINDIVIKTAIIDGISIPIYRIRSDPPIFPLTINDYNGFGIPGGYTNATADGYWVFLKYLPQGEHNIYFHGSCSGGIRNVTTSYHLRVI